MDKNGIIGVPMLLAICAGIPLLMLICAIPVGYAILGMGYFPSWYRPTVTAMVLAYAIRAVFSTQVRPLLGMLVLALVCPLLIGVAGQCSKDFAESGAQVAAVFVVVAPIVTSTICYLAARSGRRNAPMGACNEED